MDYIFQSLISLVFCYILFLFFALVVAGLRVSVASVDLSLVCRGLMWLCLGEKYGSFAKVHCVASETVKNGK